MKDLMTGADIGTTVNFRTVGPYEARHPWPTETVVSAGGGRVFIRNAKPGSPTSYGTLFMEVYPPGAAFIRGEGSTVEECENAAWGKYQLALNCTDGRSVHDWEPREYKNGAGFCTRCKTFGADVFTGAQLGQFCDVCGEGTTYDWDMSSDKTTIFHCKKHFVQTRNDTTSNQNFLETILNGMLGDDDNDDRDDLASDKNSTEASTTPAEGDKNDE